MAKLVVEIDIHNVGYDDLLKDVLNKKSDWWDKSEPGRILVDEAYLQRSLIDDSFYSFNLVGVVSD